MPKILTIQTPRWGDAVVTFDIKLPNASEEEHSKLETVVMANIADAIFRWEKLFELIETTKDKNDVV